MEVVALISLIGLVITFVVSFFTLSKLIKIKNKANISLVATIAAIVFGIMLGLVPRVGTYLAYVGFYLGAYLVLSRESKIKKKELEKILLWWIAIIFITRIVFSIISVGVLTYFGYFQ